MQHGGTSTSNPRLPSFPCLALAVITPPSVSRRFRAIGSHTCCLYSRLGRPDRMDRLLFCQFPGGESISRPEEIAGCDGLRRKIGHDTPPLVLGACRHLNILLFFGRWACDSPPLPPLVLFSQTQQFQPSFGRQTRRLATNDGRLAAPSGFFPSLAPEPSANSHASNYGA